MIIIIILFFIAQNESSEVPRPEGSLCCYVSLPDELQLREPRELSGDLHIFLARMPSTTPVVKWHPHV